MKESTAHQALARPLFLVIDGSNIYLQKTEWIDQTNDQGVTYPNPEYPDLQYVEAIVAFCLWHQIAFSLHFDAPATYHFEAAQERKSPPGILERYRRLQFLRDANGNPLTNVTLKGQADSHILEQARTGNQAGFDSYIITSDKFRQAQYRRYDDVLGQRDKQGWPERVLVASASYTQSVGSKLTFEAFPGASTSGFFSMPVEKELSADQLANLVKGYRPKTPHAAADSSEPSREIPKQNDSGGVGARPHSSHSAPHSAPQNASQNLPQAAPQSALKNPPQSAWPKALVKTQTSVRPGVPRATEPASASAWFTLDVWPLALKAESRHVRLGGAIPSKAADGSWSILIGRDDGTNQKRLHVVIDPSLSFVSGQHLRLDYQGATGVVTVTDLASANGTWSGDIKLKPNAAHNLSRARGMLTLSGSQSESGAVSLQYTLANIHHDPVGDSGQTQIRRETKVREAERVPTTMRSQGQASAPNHRAGQLNLHVLYPDGNHSVVAIDPARLPLRLGSAISKDAYGVSLNATIAPGVAPLHLSIQSNFILDKSTGALRAVNARCENLRAGYAIDGYRASDVDFVWNVNDGANPDPAHIVTLAPKGTSFGVKLWLSV